MNLPWNSWAPLVAMAGLASCSLQLDAGTSAEPPAPPDVPPPVMLAFDEPGPLQLQPGDLRTVWVTGRPPAPYEVSFSLLGDAAGAWLDRTTATANDIGRASVQLHASNLGSTFRLRAATKDGPAAELGVAVSAKGFGTLRVIPVYSGTRVAKSWTASVVAGATCEEIAKTAPEAPANALVTQGGPRDPVVVRGAPVGPSLAVALHSGHILWGCVAERDLQAGSTRDVWIPVKDLPLDLAATNMNLKLTISSGQGLDDLLTAATERLLQAFLPLGAEAASLLDAMERAAPSEQAPLFAERRRTRDWETLTQTHLGALPVPLRDRCHGWVRTGLEVAPLAIVGQLRGVEEMPGHALLDASWLGSVTADAAGVSPAQLMSWTADPGDVLRLAGTFSWSPTRYVGGAAGLGASPAESVPTALAVAAECAALGGSLGGYSGCDEDCMASLCAGGLKLRWSDALDAPDGAASPGAIVVNASGPAQVNSAAAPVTWEAAWLGTLRDGEGAEATVEGEANAISTEITAD